MEKNKANISKGETYLHQLMTLLFRNLYVLQGAESIEFGKVRKRARAPPERSTDATPKCMCSKENFARLARRFSATHY